jgi:ATP-dependent protease ClpP protease subunit
MPKLLEFRNKKPFEISCAADKSRAELVIYSSIGESIWGDSLSAKDFMKQLKELPDSVKNLDIRINSPGGDVFDGISIYNILKQHKAYKTVYIDGMAASIASIIALAGDEIVMSEGALYMIHLPWTFAGGNKNKLLETVDLLEKIEDQMVNIYFRKTKKDKNEIKAMLSKETWMSAEEALDHGFIDKKMEADKKLNIAASMDGVPWFHNRPKVDSKQEKLIKEKLKSLTGEIGGFLNRK